MGCVTVWRTSLALAAAGVALLGGLVDGSVARGGAEAPSVVFVAGPFGAERAFAVGADGRRRRALREPLRAARGWAFSPSGAVAVYTGRALLVGRDRGQMRRIAQSVTIGRIEWSSDGVTLAYGDQLAGGVLVLGPRQLRVVADGVFVGWASRTRLVFVTDATLYTVNVDGSDRRRYGLYDEKASARWSPDGRTVAYAMRDRLGVPKGLCLHRTGSRPRCRELPGDTWPHSFAWSPDSSHVAFVAAYDGLWKMRRDGSGLRRLYRLNEYQSADNVVWSPDGSMLLIEREHSLGHTTVWVVRATGVGARRVAIARTEGARASWAPACAAPVVRAVRVGQRGRRRAGLVVGLSAICAAGVVVAVALLGDGEPPAAGIGSPPTSPRPVRGYEGAQSIVFSGMSAAGAWGGWAVSPTTGAVTRLIETDWPAVTSPDGRRLAVLREDTVLIHDAQTGKRLSRARSSPVAFSWSQDGHWVSGHGTIAAADGTSARLVVRVANNGSLSPDGRHLVYEPPLNGIWVVAADGSGRRRLTPRAMGDAQRPRWSPRGDLIAFVRRGDVYVVAPDGTKLRRVGRGWSYAVEDTIGPRALSNLVWSPDGRKLAYVSRRAGSEQIHVIDLSTGREQRLTQGEDSYEPAWSLDGRWIAFTRARSGGREDATAVFVVRPEGGGLRDLTRGFRYAREPSWRRGDAEVAPLPTPKQLVLPAATEIEMPETIGQLESDGLLVAVLPPADEWTSRCGQVPVWNARDGSVQRIRAVRTCVDNHDVEIALGGGRLFALSGYAPPFQQGATETELTATRLADPKLEVAASGWWTEEDAGTEITAVAADGDAAVFSVDQASLERSSPASIQRWRSGEQRELAAASAAGEVLAVDEIGRILVRRPEGIWLLRRDGSVLLRLRDAADARSSRQRVVAVGAGRLTVYDALSARVLRRVPLAGKTEPLELADADDEFAVVVLGARMRLVRLEDGLQVEPRMPAATAPAASLEPEGLFYASGTRLAFVTRSQLARASVDRQLG